MQPILVGVIGDWSRSARMNGWPALIQSLQTFVPAQVTEYRIGDLVVNPPQSNHPTSLHDIQKQHVLVINWDAINGDPEFGAHLALQWIEHRRPELLLWVRRGNTLIIESQATLGVPTKRAYEALVGNGELPVSGLEDYQQPLGFKRQVGAKCKITKNYPKHESFERAGKEFEVSGSIKHPDLFPDTATTLLTVEIGDLDWNKILYRGWFRRKFPGLRRLPWVSIAKTSERGLLKNHSTLQVCKLGEGAIFATTMLLAMTGQRELVLAMIKCARGNTRHLPDPPFIVYTIRKYWKMALTASAGGVVGFLASQNPSLDKDTLHIVGFEVTGQNAQFIVKIAFVPLGMLLFELGRQAILVTRKNVMRIIGYW